MCIVERASERLWSQPTAPASSMSSTESSGWSPPGLRSSCCPSGDACAHPRTSEAVGRRSPTKTEAVGEEDQADENDDRYESYEDGGRGEEAPTGFGGRRSGRGIRVRWSAARHDPA